MKDSGAPSSSSATRGPPGRFVSLDVKIMASVALGVMFAVALAAYRLGDHAHAQLVESKSLAASMVTSLFAESVAPAVDFAQVESIETTLRNLKSNRDVTYAGVWDMNGERLGEYGGARGRPSPGAKNSLVIGSSSLSVARVLHDPTGKALGVVRLDFTLDPENERHAAIRREYARFGAALALGLCAVVFAAMRLQVLRPLSRLLSAAQRLEQGSRVSVSIGANDQIGRLGGAFNSMARAILDRERSLAQAKHRIQELFDNMRQAIVVFSLDGRLEDVRSRQARAVFGEGAREGAAVLELLYPSGASSIEGEAFEAWLGEVARADPEQWPALLELAPTRVTLRRESGDVELALEFIPIRDEGVVTRVMLLATDETEKQRLERAVREQEAEHQRQLNAMRRLLAGGGQLLVTTLAMGKTRLAKVAEILERSELGPAEIDGMFRQVHTIQGEARAFDLGQLGNAARVFEDYLALLRSRLRTAVAPTDDDRRVLAGHLKATLAALEGAVTLLVEASPIGPAIVEQVTVRRPDLERVLGLARDRTDELGEAIERLAARPFGEALLYLSEAVPSWAERYGRRVALEVEGRDAPIPPALARALPPALTHLARNAVVHGIEPATEREAAGKPATGRLRVRAESTPGGLEIRFSDDGRGLDRTAIEERGRALGLRGRAEELVFVPGLSTRESELSGQGVGLDAVREELHGAGYQIELVDAHRRDGEAGLEFRIFPRTNGSPSDNRSRVTA